MNYLVEPSIGGIYRAAIDAIKTHRMDWLAIALPAILLAAMSQAANPFADLAFDPNAVSDPDDFLVAVEDIAASSNLGIYLTGSLILGLLTGPILTAGAVMVWSAHRIGEASNPGETFRRALRGWWPVIKAGIALFLLALPVLIILGVVVASAAGGSSFPVAGFVLAFLILIILAILTYLTSVASVVERSGFFAPVRRSYELVRANLGLSFGLILVYLVVSIGVSLATAALVGIPTVGPALVGLITGLMTAFYAVVNTATYAAFRGQEEIYDEQALATEVASF